MTDANEILVEALLDDVLDQDILREAVEEALAEINQDNGSVRLKIERLDAELATIEQERGRLVTAIATGGELGGLLEALRTRDRRRAELDAARTAVRSQQRMQASDTSRVRDELLTLADSWHQVLASDPDHARPIVSALLVGRVTYTPLGGHRWQLTGEASLSGWFSKVFSVGLASPTGFEPVFQP
jgi:hypothetical protein